MEMCERCGGDMYLCQVCGAVLCDDEHRPVWRPDITGHAGAGNVCPECFECYETARKEQEQVGWPRREVRRMAEMEEWERCEFCGEFNPRGPECVECHEWLDAHPEEEYIQGESD